MPLPRFDKLDEPRKRSILAAAAEELAERGFAGASYNRIIERAGISKGAMYYYFADKDDLYRTVLETAIAVWFGHVAMPFEADDAGSFWRACEGMYERTLRFMLADPSSAAVCLSITRARERLEGHPALLEINQKMLEWTAELVHKGQEVGAVRTDLPPELLVQVGLSLMDAGDRWLASRWDQITEDHVDATAKTMVDLFRRVGEPGSSAPKFDPGSTRHERAEALQRTKDRTGSNIGARGTRACSPGSGLIESATRNELRSAGTREGSTR